jgi:hypothetical protein
VDLGLGLHRLEVAAEVDDSQVGRRGLAERVPA